MMSVPARVFAVVCLFFASSVLISAQSSTFTVNTTTDSVDANPGDGVCADANGLCSLRAAIMEANANTNYTEIILGAEDYVTTLTSGSTDESFGDLDIMQELRITGLGASTTFVSSGINGERVFELTSASYVELVKLTIRNGTATEGGGLRSTTPGSVYLSYVEVTNNSAENGGGIWAEAASSFDIWNSSIIGNSASDSCGGLHIDDMPRVEILRSTFAYNTAETGSGGAICFGEGLSPAGIWDISVSESSIAYNSAAISGGGIFNRSAALPAIGSSIIAENTPNTSEANCAFAAPASASFQTMYVNIFDIHGCLGHDDAFDLVTDKPIVGALGLYAPGQTHTIRLAYGSLAMDVIPCSGTSHDQRGMTRPQGTGCDIGAFELEQGPAQTYTVDSTADTIDVALGDAICADASGNCSLRAALMQANAFGNIDTIIVPVGHYISSLVTGSTDDSYGDFDMLQPANIQGVNADETIISNGITDERVLEIEIRRFVDEYSSWGESHINLERISITNGGTSENGGGILINTGLAVYLLDSEVANNAAANGGGIWIENAHFFWTDRSTIAENTALNSCGGIYAGNILRIFHAFNVTIAENSANTGEGGGLCLSEGTSETHIDLSFLTIARNTAGTIGGGILNRNTHGSINEAGNNGPYFIVISIIADNIAGSSGANCAFAGAATRALNSVGYNMFDTNGCVGSVTEDIVTATTDLGPLALHAPGHTRTINLLPDSPAIDALYPDAIGPGIDQRGAPRQSGYGIDIGAYEFTAPGAWVLRPELPPYDPDLFPLKVTEGETTSSFMINIGSEPQGTVVYTFSDAGGDLSFDPPQVVFTAENWNDPEAGIVTVSAVNDVYVEGLENTEVVVTVGGTAPEYADVLPRTPITVEITDNDSPQISVAPSMTPPLVVSEDGTTASFDISINSEPTGTVSVTFGGAGSDFAFDVPSVEFNATNWQMPVTVTVSTSDDGIAEGTKNGAITFTVGGTAAEYVGMTLPNLAVSVLDDDSAAVNIMPSALPLSISEDGTTASFDISLDSEPTGTVIVTFGGAGSDFALDVPSVEFNAANWQTPVTVTVSTPDDGIAEGTKNGAITFTVGGTAAEYAGMTLPNLAVSVLDDDSAAVDIMPSTLPLSISEDGITGSFDISLDSEPTGTVSVTFGGAGSDFVLDLPSVEFDATNWDTPVTVSVSAIDDDEAEGTENGAIMFAVEGTSAEYSGVTHGNLPVKITDNDAALVTEDLITNGGWETGGVTAWKYTSALAKRQCKGTGNGSHCALLLKPGTPIASAYQDVAAGLVPFEAGDKLHFEFAVKITGTAKLNAILKLKYLNGTVAKLKVRPIPANTAGSWVVFSLEDSSAALLNLKAIRIQFKRTGTTGKIRVDDVMLQRISTMMLPRGEANPLPVPPEGFRGGN